MAEEILEMSHKERERLVIIKNVINKKISQVNASKLLKITDRQVRNLVKAWKKEGDRGLISKKRGKTSNHQSCADKKNQILKIIREKLNGFGPTLAREKLKEIWSISIGKETLRQWMLEANITYPKRKVKQRKIHKPRDRRSSFGELVQADGSHHRWFGEDKEMVNLTVLIDDATGKLTGLHFSETETLQAYHTTLKQHLLSYGRPLSLYTDRSAVAEVRQGDSTTQFHKSLNELDIDLILANSPQAKGRVERANRTLQDRLVKELHFRGIKTIKDANEYLPEFIEEFNKKFSRVPASNFNAHRSLEGYDLLKCLTVRTSRTLTAACIFRYKNNFFEVKGLAQTRNHKGRKVDLRIRDDGSMRAFIDGIERKIIKTIQPIEPSPPPTMNRKEVKAWKPKKDHPWRRWASAK